MPMIAAHRALPKLRRLIGRLREDCSGLAFMEFAFSMPIVLTLGGFGVELSNLALCNLRVSQYALNLADDASRVGVDAGAGVTQIREADINDIFQGVRLEGSAIDIATHGRVTLTSLENIQQSYDTAPVQRIHWQRCLGMMSGSGYDSTYGTTTATAGSDNTQANAGTTMAGGMGPTGQVVSPPSGSGVMFVEINYEYQPVFGSFYLSKRTIHYIASFIVRDNRDFTQIYNPSPTASAATCDKYTT